MQIKACSVRKGMRILIGGQQGPLLVTKREKWNSTHCRIYYTTDPERSIPVLGFEYFSLDDVVELHQTKVQEAK